MKKRIAIIGTGFSGTTIADLFLKIQIIPLPYLKQILILEEAVGLNITAVILILLGQESFILLNLKLLSIWIQK